MNCSSGLAALIAGGVMLTAGTAAAQRDTTHTARQVAIGDRVRLWERVASDVSVPVTGHIDRLAPDTITLAAESVRQPLEVPWPAVTRMEISAGPRTGSRAMGALTGGVIGALGGAVLGAIAGNMAHRNAPEIAVIGFVVGGAGGAAVGAYSPGERWDPVTPIPPAAAH